MADVRFQHVYKRYGDNPPVIVDLNLEVADREFLVLVGPSGCGKSTALRMIAGLEDISRGRTLIGDRLVNDVAPKDRDIAMVFQNYALYPHMTVCDNMAFALKLRHIPKRRSQHACRGGGADTWHYPVLDASRASSPAASGSGWPLAARGARATGFPVGRAALQSRRQAAGADARGDQPTAPAPGTTFVYVTHDQVEAMTMGDRIAVMNAGVIQQLGTPQDLYDTPANLFVAGFIGSPSMDFFEAKLQRRSDGRAKSPSAKVTKSSG